MPLMAASSHFAPIWSTMKKMTFGLVAALIVPLLLLRRGGWSPSHDGLVWEGEETSRFHALDIVVPVVSQDVLGHVVALVRSV